jgi:hypothetical protein
MFDVRLRGDIARTSCPMGERPVAGAGAEGHGQAPLDQPCRADLHRHRPRRRLDRNDITVKLIKGVGSALLAILLWWLPLLGVDLHIH